MKRITRISVLSASVCALFLASCATTDKTGEKEAEEQKIEQSESGKGKTDEENKGGETEKSEQAKAQKPKRAYVAPIPEIAFSGNAMRLEIENMFAENIDFSYDEEYSNRFAGTIKSSVSVAKAFVSLEAGSYEILAREKAKDSEHAAFYIFVDNEPYRVSPSEPPLQSFENTTRTPITFRLEEGAKVLITVQANSPHHPGQTGMMIDYLQIRKLN